MRGPPEAFCFFFFFFTDMKPSSEFQESCGGVAAFMPGYQQQQRDLNMRHTSGKKKTTKNLKELKQKDHKIRVVL